jgi:hypothetical protein
MTDNKNFPTRFIIPLKQNDTQSFETVSMLILAISYFSFLYKALVRYRLVEIIVMAVMAVALGVWYFNIRKGALPQKYGYIIFMITGAVWFYQTGIGFALGVLVMLAGILQTRIKEVPAIIAGDGGIAVKTIFTKRYAWGDLNNVIIKDGLLTIDCKDNHLFQKETSPDIVEQYEKEFNEFCSLKVHGQESIVHGEQQAD